MDASGDLLPRFSTSFVGRAREGKKLLQLTAQNRFVGVTGPGGVGKTRLATRVAEQLRTAFADGVTAVDLVGVVTPSEMCARTAASVGMRDADSATFTALISALRDTRMLLLLDGCEVLDSDCLLLVQDLLEHTEQVSVLATSRRALHVDGGLLMTLPPLSVPPIEFELPETNMTAAEVAPYEAVDLFVQRARLVREDFELTDENALSVATLCRRLDGLPLALELAASWVRALSVAQIVERMETTTDFPRAGTINVAPRHRTLSSLVAGTFELCSPEEQLLWCRMTVFVESFDLPAVEAVCGAAPLDQVDLLDTIASLVDQSVVVVDDISGHSRYRLLGLTRDYAAQRAAELDDVHARHREYFDNYMQEYTERLPGPNQVRLLSRAEADYPNIITALDAGLGHPETAEASVRMAADLWSLWFATGRLSEGRRVLRRAAAAPLVDPAATHRIRALYFNAYLCMLQSELRSARKLHEVATATDHGGHEDLLCRGLAIQLDAMIRMGNGEADAPSAILDRAIDTFAAGDDPRNRVSFMDAIGIAVLLAALRGDSQHAMDLGERGLSACDDSGDVVWRAYIDYALGVDAWMQQSYTRATSAALKALLVSPDRLLATHSIELLAWCASSEGDYARAARLFGSADRRWEQVGGPFSGFSGISVHRDRCLKATREGQTVPSFDSAYAAGRLLAVGDIVAETQRTQVSAGAIPVPAVEADDWAPLTSREREVAALVAQGLSNREIAQSLTISPRTAESHVDHILTKLNLPNRRLVAAWMRARRR